MGNINNCSFKNALWIGRCKHGDEPMRIYVHGEYKDRAGRDRLSVNKGDTPSRYRFGVKREHIVWIMDDDCPIAAAENAAICRAMRND